MGITPLTRNITRLYRGSSAVERSNGRNWYAAAYNEAEELAVGFQRGDGFREQAAYPVHVAVGVIAALSPRLGWGPNLRLAADVLDGRRSGGLGANIRKAEMIINGADPLDVLTSPKVSNFYRAIISRGADGIVIDRHAWDVATGSRHDDSTRIITDARYARAAECYRRAASILSRDFGQTISPAHVQATTWLTWRSRYWAPGAFDPKGTRA